MYPRSTALLILAGTALSTSYLHVALAQDAVQEGATSPHSTIHRRAQSGTVADTNAAETITVRTHSTGLNGVTGVAPGGGLISVETQPRSISMVTRDFIAKLTPTSSAAQIIQLTPGANIASSDPFGLSDQSEVTVRGLGEDEIGFLYEGMPVADIDTYQPFASEWGDSENYQSVSLAQGTVDLTAPLSNSAGGEVTVNLRDPPRTPGGLIDYSYGSYKTQREFIRLDTGDLFNTGVRAFVSFSDAVYGTWRGAGRGSRPHEDFKLVKEWGDGNRFSFALANAENNQPSYLNPTLAQYKQFGDSLNYDGKTGTGFDPNYWQLQLAAWHDIIISSPSHFTLAHNLSLDVVPYYYWGTGGYGFGTSIDQSPSFLGTEEVTTPLVVNPHELLPDGTIPTQAYVIIEEFHPGLTTHLNYQVGHNDATLGWWYDYFDDHQAQGFQQTTSTGDVPNAWGTNLLKYPNGVKLEGEDYHLVTQINGLFIGDTISLLHDRLKVSAGFREMMATRYGTNNLPGPQYAIASNDAEPLPRFSVSYDVDDHNQVFADTSGNARLPAATTYFDSYDVFSGTISSVGTKSLKDEYSIQEELGYRYTGTVVATVTGFNYNFTDRNVETVTSLNGALNNTFIDAGGQSVRGVDLSAGPRPLRHLSPYASFEYLQATTDNDLPASTTSGTIDYLPTAGKTPVRSPRFTAIGAIAYDDGTFFGNLTYKWVSSEYGDFMNEEKIPSHGVVDLILGFRLPTIRYAKKPTIQLNLVNLSNAHYLSGIYSTTLNAATTRGVYGGTIAGSSPTYLIGSGFAAMMTATVGF